MGNLPTILQGKTLLQILPALNSGGVERGTVDIARAAKAAGMRSMVASSGGSMVPMLARHGVEHITLPLGTRSLWGIWRNRKRLRRLMRRESVNIVHARSRAPAWSAYYAAKRLTLPFVTTFHGAYRCNVPGKKRYNRVMTYGQKVIAVSDFIAQHMQEVYGVEAARIVTIPRGVDMALFDPAAVSVARMEAIRNSWRLPDGIPLIFLPGRMVGWKGQFLLLHALARLPAGTPFYCVMAGAMDKHPRYVDRLKQEILRLKLEHHVRMSEAITDMPAAYALADVVVSASTEPEAFGRVAVEAQAMGKPVVATALGGACETVIDHHTGRLVDPHDPADMAQALHRAISFPEGRQAALSERCRAHVAEHFSLQQMCDNTLQLYADLLEEKDA